MYIYPLKIKNIVLYCIVLYCEAPKFGFATKMYVRRFTHGICILDFSYAIKHTKSQMVEHFLLLSIAFKRI